MVTMLGLILLNSCAVTPPDIFLCTEIHPNKGFCVRTISSKEFEITKDKKYKGKSWWELRPTMIYMPSESWVDIKKFIIKICKKSKRCSGKSVSNWQRTVKKIDTNIAQ